MNNFFLLNYNAQRVSFYIKEYENGNLVTTHNLLDFVYGYLSDPYAYDADFDGDNDIIYKGYDGMYWFENVNGVYQTAEMYIPNVSFTHFSMVDLNGDDLLDVVYGDMYSGDMYRLGTGVFAQFGEEYLLPAAALAGSFFTDFNGDGAVDFLSGGQPQPLYVYLNIGPIGNQISGNIRLDIQDDGCDETDIPLANILVTTDNGDNSFSTFTDANGFYSFLTNPGVFTTTIENPNSDAYGVSPEFHTSDFPDLIGEDIADFCLDVLQEINDVNIVVHLTNNAVPGFVAEYRIYYRNVGNTSLSGEISLSFDEEKLNFLTASEPISSQSSGTITFEYSDLLPFQSEFIDLTFQVEPPPITEIDDILTFTAEVTPIVGDATEDDNTFVYNQTVVGSYDPNDIMVLEGEEIYLEQADEYLHYMIRFQNVGTAQATFIRVTNQLDDDLDWTTLQIESISHDYNVEILDGNDITFFFDAIYLPSSTTDEEGSHGFITYKIKPKNPASLGDEFTNNANIYFDYNPPVATNTVTTTIVENLSDSENALNDLKVYPNPTNRLLNIQSNTAIVSVEIINQIGQEVLSENNSEAIKRIDIVSLTEGLYFIKLKDSQGNSIVKKLIKE